MDASQLVETQCPQCGNSQQRLLFLVAGHLRHVRCAACGLVYLSPRYTDEFLHRIYQEHDVPFVKRWRESRSGGAAPSVAEYQQLVDRCLPYETLKLELLARYAPEKTLLDVGFGAGLFLASAQRLGWAATGVELKASSCQFLTAMLGIPAQAHELPEVDLGAQQFGAVTLIDTLEHLTRPRQYLDKAFALLKPGGVLFISVPNTASVEVRLRGGKARPLAVRHYHLLFFTAATLARMLTASGFTSVTRLHPSQCKPLAGMKWVLESACYALGAENTLRVIARKPG
jgi:2-polyprenyl-3-methyl-5-hydroxy-6-metoxy-1,4-benzoquinol methylase